MIKPIHSHPAAPSHHAHAVNPKVVAKNAFTKLYDANQSEDLAKRPGWPDAPGQVKKLTGGAELEALGVEKLPKGSKAAQAIAKLVAEGLDGDQSAYRLKVGKETYLVVAAFPEDAARDQIWIFDAKGQKQIAQATPNEETGKLLWS